MFNQVVTKLSHICFDTCVSTPGTKLSSYESNCIESCIGRYTDSTKLIAARLQQQGGDDHLS